MVIEIHVCNVVGYKFRTEKNIPKIVDNHQPFVNNCFFLFVIVQSCFADYSVMLLTFLPCCRLFRPVLKWLTFHLVTDCSVFLPIVPLNAWFKISTTITTCKSATVQYSNPLLILDVYTSQNIRCTILSAVKYVGYVKKKNISKVLNLHTVIINIYRIYPCITRARV